MYYVILLHHQNTTNFVIVMKVFVNPVEMNISTDFNLFTFIFPTFHLGCQLFPFLIYYGAIVYLLSLYVISEIYGFSSGKNLDHGFLGYDITYPYGWCSRFLQDTNNLPHFLVPKPRRPQSKFKYVNQVAVRSCFRKNKAYASDVDAVWTTLLSYSLGPNGF
jgi:hypothetical protein